MNIVNCLYKNRAKTKTALRYGKEEISYSELWNKSVKLSKSLENCKDEVIGLYIPNSINYVIAYFAILISNKIVLPVHFMLKKPEIEGISKVCGVKTFFSVSDAQEIHKIQDADIKVINVDEYDFDIKLQGNEEFVFAGSENVALIIPTSGTTDKPKYVQLTHDNITTSLEGILKIHHLKENQNELIILPMTSAFCNTTQMLVCLLSGMTITILEGKFNFINFFRTVESNKITYCEMTPSVLKLLSKVYDPKKHDISSMTRISIGGEMITHEELVKIRAILPSIIIINGYGMTEASPIISGLTYDEPESKLTSVGKPYYKVSVKIVDKDGRDLEPGKQGRILVKGPNVMKGYYNEEKQIVIDGWLHTGDIGYLDEDGYLYITGREKNIIISGGQNICPEEVEACLNSHDMVKESKVMAEKDSVTGEIVVAQIVLNVKGQFERNKIVEHCKSHLANYKIPKKFYIVDELEKSASGKIKR